MKETGIIMSGSHPVDILEGRKTQTRRVIKGLPNWVNAVSIILAPQGLFGFGEIKGEVKGRWFRDSFKCPYGQVGDRLWVKETFALRNDGKQVLHKAGYEDIVKALDLQKFIKERGLPALNIKWTSPLFMSRCDSRITLEITGLRVERLQEITEEDAEAEGEGWSGVGDGENYDVCSAIENYAHLWDSLNAKRGYGWEKNPWVWVIEFKILQ